MLPLLVLGIGATSVLAPELVPAELALLLAWDLRPRPRPKRTTLVCEGGALVVPGSGRIRARDLLGATTCRHGDGVSLMLHHKRRRLRPIVLDLPSEDALATVCRSLGIGHHGFGFVDAAVTPSNGHWLQVVSAAASLVLALPLLSHDPDTVAMVAPLFVVSFGVWVLTTLTMLRPSAPTVRLTSGGVYLPLPAGSTPVPFQEIQRVDVTPGALRLTVERPTGTTVVPVPIAPSRWTPRGPSFDELAHVAEQIQAAADRAHGKFVVKTEPESLAAMLARAERESTNDWRARIDTIVVGTAGYRATAADAADLWRLLEDPEAKPDVRAAAARILARHDQQGLRVRIADVLASVRDEPTRARIAESLEDELEEESAGSKLTASS